ncbi:LPXTG cell wall anchor domain-containing protein [Streptomyces sp. NPDC089424]|uniref:LPXTG cell wall anchor domain-containing protein n=1 Tax=Streptomyces sp. NPDC089424 TaxID=3365917 RepID=UPI00380D1DFE
MSSARRPLLTATAAGTLLGALWFVPSANATSDGPLREQAVAVMTQARATTTDTSTTSDPGSAADADTGTGSRTETGTGSGAESAISVDGGTRLADTGSFDSTPYVLGGALCLALGAGFVAYSVRRERLGF